MSGACTPAQNSHELGGASVAGSTNIRNPDITCGGPAGLFGRTS